MLSASANLLTDSFRSSSYKKVFYRYEILFGTDDDSKPDDYKLGFSENKKAQPSPAMYSKRIKREIPSRGIWARRSSLNSQCKRALAEIEWGQGGASDPRREL